MVLLPTTMKQGSTQTERGPLFRENLKKTEDLPLSQNKREKPLCGKERTK
jgi:hypothetical protein